MRLILWIAGTLVVLVVLAMQIQPSNPGVSTVHAATSFDATMHANPQVLDMLHRSCYNCHAAQADLPWYSHVWPASRLLDKDIRRARARLDFSTWSNLSPELARIRLLSSCQMMQDAKMPLWYYRPLHPGSAPQQEQIDAFCAWAQSLPAGEEKASLR